MSDLKCVNQLNKRILYMILFSAAFVSGLTACQDFLVREPKLEQSNEITLSTYDGLNSATAGLYGYLSEIGWYGSLILATARGSVLNPDRFFCRNLFIAVSSMSPTIIRIPSSALLKCESKSPAALSQASGCRFSGDLSEE